MDEVGRMEAYIKTLEGDRAVLLSALVHLWDKVKGCRCAADLARRGTRKQVEEAIAQALGPPPPPPDRASTKGGA